MRGYLIEKNEQITDINDLEKLFESWKKAHACEKNYECIDDIPKDSFTYDGVINEKIWDRQKTKVLYILRESNGQNTEEGYFWFKEMIEKGQITKNIFKRINSMQNILNKTENDNRLNEVAYINVNKRGGGSSVNWKRMIKYTKEYKEFIRREIEIINPEIIVCCGTYWLILNYIYDKKQKYAKPENEYYYELGNVKVYNMWHPSARISDENYISRMKYINNLINKKGDEIKENITYEKNAREKLETIMGFFEDKNPEDFMDFSNELIDELYYYIEEYVNAKKM